jgi:hypothetical protein
MAVDRAVSSHHTVWIHDERHRAVPERYAVDGDRVVCFGDRGLAKIPDGSQVWASVHEIAGGAALASFSAVVRQLAFDEIPAGALAELLDHVSLGRTSDEVAAQMEAQGHRRIIELVL